MCFLDCLFLRLFLNLRMASSFCHFINCYIIIELLSRNTEGSVRDFLFQLDSYARSQVFPPYTFKWVSYLMSIQLALQRLNELFFLKHYSSIWSIESVLLLIQFNIWVVYYEVCFMSLLALIRRCENRLVFLTTIGLFLSLLEVDLLFYSPAIFMPVDSKKDFNPLPFCFLWGPLRVQNMMFLGLRYVFLTGWWVHESILMMDMVGILSSFWSEQSDYYGWLSFIFLRAVLSFHFWLAVRMQMVDKIIMGDCLQQQND